MLKLFIKDTDVSTGSLPVTWCIDDETIMYLKENNVKNPYVCIHIIPLMKADIHGTIVPNNYRIYCISVPLNKLMAYIPLRFKGKNLIFATVDSSKAIPSSLRIDNYDDINGGVIRVYGVLASELKAIVMDKPIEIDVPEECFAKEPSEWEKSWVNLMFDSRAEDQCEFRRRRLWAYSGQILIFLVILITNIGMTLAALLYGARNLSFEYIKHPVIKDAGGEMFSNGTLYVGRGKNKYLNWASLPLMPLISIPVMTFIYLGLVGVIPKILFMSVLGFTIVFPLIFIGVYFIGMMLDIFFDIKILDNFIKKIFYKEKFHWDSTEELEAITCDGFSKKADISFLSSLEEQGV